MDWREQTDSVQARQKLHNVRQTMAQVREQIETLQQAIMDGDQKLIALRADQIVRDSTNDERYELAAITLADQREQLRNLEAELKALVMAEHKVEQTCREADRVARGQAAEHLLNDYRDTIAQLQEVLEKAERINNHLAELDTKYRKSDLSESGGKTLTLLLRGGGAWSAMTPPPIHGNPIHLVDWRKYIKGALGEL
jgi:hypothetical protein